MWRVVANLAGAHEQTARTVIHPTGRAMLSLCGAARSCFPAGGDATAIDRMGLRVMLSAAQARASIDDSGEDGYVLAYQPIGVHVDRMLFPCYADGRVDLDRLEPLQLNDYLFARALVGHAYSEPSIVRVDLAPAL